MNNYYEEMLEKIVQLMNDSEYNNALEIIKEELKMPYIPNDIEIKLNQLEKECQSIQKQNDKVSFQMDDEEITTYLYGTKDKQLKACDYLNSLNLRNYSEIVNDYLSNNPDPMAQALLIDSLIDQEISYEVSCVVDNEDITFIPRYIEKAVESDGFIEAKNFIENEFENDNPSMAKMCMQLLIQEAYLHSPINFEENEGAILAYSIIIEVYEMLQDFKQLEVFKNKYRSFNEKNMQLLSVKIDI